MGQFLDGSVREHAGLNAIHHPGEHPCYICYALSLAEADLARRKVERVPSQLNHCHLERDTGTQTGLLKDHRQGLASKDRLVATRFPFGFEGLSYRHGHVPIELNPKTVQNIHQQGGTILGSSRGPQEVTEMVDTLEQMNVGMLFTIGGDGTLRGAQDIAEEIDRRKLKIAVIGVPKTIDNDISYVQQSFGFVTAVSEATTAIYSAHAEASGARNGIGLVKLMGRHAGFIAAYATLANSDVNFCLVPEVPFTKDGFLRALEERLVKRGHAVVVVAEGAGQNLMGTDGERDASGNIRLGDIGIFLKEQITAYFKGQSIESTLKYIDPSYIIRSMPATPPDSAFCLMLGHNAVHAGMAGRTSMVVGYWKNEFTHVPISATVSKRKQVDPKEKLRTGVLSSTGQPREMC